MCKPTNSWSQRLHCPVCHAEMHLYDIRVDTYILSILENLTVSATHVKLYMDGKWEPISNDKHSRHTNHSSSSRGQDIHDDRSSRHASDDRDKRQKEVKQGKENESRDRDRNRPKQMDSRKTEEHPKYKDATPALLSDDHRSKSSDKQEERKNEAPDITLGLNDKAKYLETKHDQRKRNEVKPSTSDPPQVSSDVLLCTNTMQQLSVPNVPTMQPEAKSNLKLIESPSKGSSTEKSSTAMKLTNPTKSLLKPTKSILKSNEPMKAPESATSRSTVSVPEPVKVPEVTKMKWPLIDLNSTDEMDILEPPKSTIPYKKFPLPRKLSEDLTILNIGTIRLDDGWHNNAYIYPLGFKSNKRHDSMVTPNKMINYVNEVCSRNEKPYFRYHHTTAVLISFQSDP